MKMDVTNNNDFQKAENKQAITFNSNNPMREIKLWSDGSVSLQAIIGKTKIINSSVLIAYLFPDLQIDETKQVSAEIKEDKKNFLVKLSITKKVNIKRGKKKQKLIIACKEFARLMDRQIIINILAKEIKITPIFELILRFVSIGYEIQQLVPILQSTASNVPLENKYAILELFFQFLTSKKELIPILQFKSYYGKNIQLYDNDIVAATFDGGITEKTDVQIPNSIGNLFIRNNKRIVIIRDNQITCCTVTKIDKSYRCDSSVTMNIGKKVHLLWFGLERTEDYKQLILLLKKKKDYRSHLALAFYKNLEENEKSCYLNVIKGLEYFCRQGFSLPIIRNKVRNSKHLSEDYEFLVTEYFKSLNQNLESTKYSFVTKEILLSNVEGSYFKSIDWYIVQLEDNKIVKYLVELKTCQGNEKTRVLQRTIAELSTLLEKIPEAGLPIIIVNWLLNKEKWIDYAAKFGVILLDCQDIYTLIKEGDFFGKIKEKSKLIQNNNSIRLTQNKQVNEASYTLIEKWHKTQIATRDEIRNYCSLMKLPIQNYLNLLNYLAITTLHANSSYYRYSKIIITKPKKLKNLHNKLLKGTSLLIEEELAHCKRRINTVTTQKLQPNTTLSFQRRRQTYDLDRLNFVYKNLKTLLSLRDYWGKQFRPLGVRMLQHQENQGAAFEQWVCHELQKEHFQIIQNVSVLISNKPREIDIIGFLKESSSYSRLMVSCVDSSHYRKKFYHAKRSIIGRLRNLQLLLKEIGFHQARLYVRVRTSHQKELVNRWIQEEGNDDSKIVVKIFQNS